MFICWVSLFCNGWTHLGQQHRPCYPIYEGPYLWRKVVCFVCTYEIHRTGILKIIFLKSLESSRWGEVHGLGSITFILAVSKFLNIEWFFHWKFQTNWNVPLVLLERSWWAGINGIHLLRFGFRMWEILIFKWFFQLKIKINPKKPGFGRKNQLRTW
jgi:hypothetical protein